MHFLPIAERELRVASRQARTYWTRLAAGLVGIAVAGYFFWVISAVAGANSGRKVFDTLTHLAFFVCLFAGPMHTADCLSREKRDGTLGFLFLTNLRTYDIVIGKLAATSVHFLYGMAATVPVFALCLIAGGVQAGEFARIILSLLNTLFFSLATGLLVSAWVREERRAVQTTSLILLLFGFVLPLLGEYLRRKTALAGVSSFLSALSPGLSLGLGTLPSSTKLYLMSLGVVHFLAWVALAIACRVLRYSWQDRPSSERMPWRERMHRWLLRRAGPSANNRHWLDANPFCWLALRSRLVVWETWLLLGVAVLVAAWSVWLTRGKIPVIIPCLMLAIALHSIAKMQLCAAACDRLAEDKRSGALEMLLGTPIRISEMLRGQMLALIRQFWGVLTAVVVLDFVMLFLVLALPEPDGPREPDQIRLLLLLLFAGVFLLVIDAAALGWVGMWHAVQANNIQQARSRTQLRILILPWVVLILWMSYVGIYRGRVVQPAQMLWVWFGLGLVNSVLFSLDARRKLLGRLRLLVTDRFQSLPSGGDWFATLTRPAGHSLPSEGRGIGEGG